MFYKYTKQIGYSLRYKFTGRLGYMPDLHYFYHMIERLASPTPDQLDALTALWEASIRATHHFAAEEDILFYRQIVRSKALVGVELYVLRNSDGTFAAFMGLEGDKIEMLFVSPSLRGKGLGKQFVTYAVTECGMRLVDVNEQNTQAMGFYDKLGCRTISRDELDPSGRPYPILHLALPTTL